MFTKQMKRVKACNFMNFEEALDVFSLSAGISLVSSSGVLLGDRESSGFNGDGGTTGNQLSTGSGAFISALKL